MLKITLHEEMNIDESKISAVYQIHKWRQIINSEIGNLVREKIREDVAAYNDMQQTKYPIGATSPQSDDPNDRYFNPK